MLERAAGCFETAGRRFFRDPNGAIRTRRSLCHHFWKHNLSGGDAGHWFLALTQPLSQHSTVSTFPHRSRSAHDANSPFLDFLYPQKTQEFAALRVSRLPRRPGLRRRKRTLANLRRTYVSEATSLERIPHDDLKAHGLSLQQDLTDEAIEPTTAAEVDSANSNIQQPRQDKQSLHKLREVLRSRGKNHSTDEAWVLYLAAGRPRFARHALCHFLSRSREPGDAERAWELFQSIPRKQRTRSHFCQITLSQLHFAKTENLVQICEWAAGSRNFDSCFAFVFYHFVECHDWVTAEKIWGLQTKSKSSTKQGEQKAEILSPIYPTSKVPEDALALAAYLEHGAIELSAGGSFRQIAQLLLKRISTSSELLTGTSMDILVPLMQKYINLELMTLQHCIDIIESVQSSTKRLDFTRSIIFYQTLRVILDRQSKSRLPKRLWERQLELLVKFEMTNYIRYFLDELAHFHDKPSVRTYNDVLNYFAYAGNVSEVNILFDKLMADHGKPKSRRLVTPLMHVHAAFGNVSETLENFRRLSEEFHLEPNTICWNIVLTAFANKGDAEGTFSHFSQMIEAKIPPDSHTYGILMGICARKGDVDGVRALLREAENQSVTITMAMLGTVAHAYLGNGRFDLAEQLAIKCLDVKLEGSPMRLWNMLLMHYAYRIDHKSFYRVCRLMAKAKLQPDETTYAADLLRLALVGKTDQARATLRRHHMRGVYRATELHYAILILGYIKMRHFTMVKIIFREMIDRFPNSGLEASLSNLEAGMPSEYWKTALNEKEVPAANADIRMKTLEAMLMDSLHRYSIYLLSRSRMFQSSEGRSEYLTKAFDSWHDGYLIKRYGARGAMPMTRELFQRQLSKASSTQQHPGSSSAPLRLVNAMMAAHLKAGEHEEVDECWQLAFSSAIKMASRVKVENILKPLPSNTPALPDLPAHHQSKIMTADSLNDQDNQILPSRRFILSRSLSLFMRSLAGQNKLERMTKVITEVEAAGFEMSTFNQSTLVQLLALSKKFDYIADAFRVFETLFMPNWPGWNQIVRSKSLKPIGTPEGVDLFRRKREPSQTEHFPNKEATKYWKNISPGFMQPTYVTIVHLASGLEHVRGATIVKGSHELAELYKIAPMTLGAIAKMPYKRERWQGVLLRQRARQADLEKSPVGFGYAPGGVLGVGSRALRANFASRDKVQDVELAEWVDNNDSNHNGRKATSKVKATAHESMQQVDEPKQTPNEPTQTPDQPTQTPDPANTFFKGPALDNTGWENILSPADLRDLQVQARRNISTERKRPKYLRTSISNPLNPAGPQDSPAGSTKVKRRRSPATGKSEHPQNPPS
ncbi:hypothetical protein N7490_001480 [Penicillium lividum]|nr:hypothetical protein N7490_001480 [Penicillium lividum]